MRGEAPDARTIVLQQLTAAPRTRSQLATTLAKRDVPEDVANEVLDRFVEVGLIDDQAFGRAWVESRHRGRGLARRALRIELSRKGLDNDDIAAALELVDDEDELARARGLVAAKIGSTRRFERDARVRRLTGMLARKGYPPGVCARVVSDALRAEGEAELDVSGLIGGGSL